MHSGLNIKKRFTNMVATVFVLLLSLLMLVYVGLAEAYRTYPRFEIDKLTAQGEIIKNTMETFLIAGLPLEQFPGFSPLSQPLLDSDKSIAGIKIINEEGQLTFSNAQPGINIAVIKEANFMSSTMQEKDSRYQISENKSYYKVDLPLRNKFENVGNLEMIMPKQAIASTINSHFILVEIAIGISLLIYAVFIKVGHFLEHKTTRWLDISYSFIFFTVATITIFSLVNLYSAGIQGKTKALATSLSQRLNAALEIGLELSDFEGLDQIISETKTINPDISEIALTSGNTIALHTDNSQVGKNWQPKNYQYEYDIKLQNPTNKYINLNIGVRVGIPKKIIYSKLWRSVKNFFVLFIASAFLSGLFNKVMRSFIGKSNVIKNTISDYQLNIIEPVYFLGVFVEGLATSFLPQHFRNLATASEANISLVSTLFTVYFAFFVIALIPAGKYAQSRGIKPLLLVGAILSATAMLLMAFVTNFYVMFIIRALAGFGQGLLYIGVQSYILEFAQEEKKTQGAAIIVFGYNGGMISGTAIGSLLVTYTGNLTVFFIGGLISLFSFYYIYYLIEETNLQSQENPKLIIEKPNQNQWHNNVCQLLKDLQFVSSMLLIGIPAKAVLTGVTIFALPLLLSRQNYPPEDIGQILMFYAAGVLISSRYISRLVDKIGKTGNILFLGTLGSGLGLFIIGTIGLDKVINNPFSYHLPTLLLIVGMTILGLSQGFIHAPIVTYITDSRSATTLGKSTVASVYRLLERIGHVIGPIIVGQLLLLNQENAFTISWLGIATFIFGLLFAMSIIRFNKTSPI